MQDQSVLTYFKNKWKQQFSKFDGLVFGIAFLLAMLCHLYMFTHKFINHDDVDGLYSSCAFGLSSGRWLLETLCSITGHFSSSWLNGLAGALCLAGAAVLIVKMLDLKHLLSASLVSLCLVAFPTVASTYAYMFSSAPYLTALFLAVAGAFLIRKERWHTQIAGGLLVALSMGAYQAYFCLAAVLLVTLLIVDLCKDRFGGDWKSFFAVALRYVLFLAAGMAVYYGILQILLAVTGTELVSYQGISEMGKLTVESLLRRIVYAYGCYFGFFVGQWLSTFPQWFAVPAVLSMLTGLVAVAVCVVRKKLYRKFGTFFFLIVLLLVFPLASNLVFVMAGEETVHLLMIYPLVLTLLLPALPLDRLSYRAKGRMKKYGVSILAVGLILLQGLCGYECFYLTNRAYFAMDITYENTYAYYTKLAAKIELTEGYTPETPVAVIGEKTINSFVPEPHMTGVLVGDKALNIYSWDRILTYYLGTTYCYASQEQKDVLTANEIYQQMPVYPAEGSIRNIDGVIAVKLA
ncbi:MAG: glucosyltransferase domain-containing protein [Clostridia bacterium]|nr:glucosyltransferase domain-containing protein [Clostridia bacterium]